MSAIISDYLRAEIEARTNAELARLRARLTKTNEHWRRQSRDCFEAFSAMRDAINEVVPMQSAEADLLDGPEMFVSCEAVATAVISHVRAAEARAEKAVEDMRAMHRRAQRAEGHLDVAASIAREEVDFLLSVAKKAGQWPAGSSRVKQSMERWLASLPKESADA